VSTSREYDPHVISACTRLTMQQTRLVKTRLTTYRSEGPNHDTLKPLLAPRTCAVAGHDPSIRAPANDAIVDRALDAFVRKDIVRPRLAAQFQRNTAA